MRCNDCVFGDVDSKGELYCVLYKQPIKVRWVKDKNHIGNESGEQVKCAKCLEGERKYNEYT